MREANSPHRRRSKRRRDSAPSLRSRGSGPADGDELLRDGERGAECPIYTDLVRRLEHVDLPDPVRETVDRELEAFLRLGTASPEAQVLCSHLEVVERLPWNERTRDRLDLERAERMLDRDHVGLETVKDRILEFLAVVRSRVEGGTPAGASRPRLRSSRTADAARMVARGPLLLFVGPPGVGKTSIARSIAGTLGRRCVHLALGGIHSEAAIRGHRRTYLGAMPGRILQGLMDAGTCNPVFVLDEIDKLQVSTEGDPAAALMEVLDPEQNERFTDQYLNLPFDLSEVLFIATANSTQSIPKPLLDRMETIEVRGYVESEKLEIARKHVVPRHWRDAGLDQRRVKLTREAVSTIVSDYTREGGVRELERKVGALARRLVRERARGNDLSGALGRAEVHRLLGQPAPEHARPARTSEIGVATAPYCGASGGDVLFVEATVLNRDRDDATSETVPRLILTGWVGDQVSEAAQVALTYLAAEAEARGEQIEATEAHIHFPRTRSFKEGSSGGVAIALALSSALSERPVRPDVAMTGEISLRGRVLAVGGIREKVIGAIRVGLTAIIVPADNQPDVDALPREVREAITIHTVERLEQVFGLALVEDGAEA